MIAEAVIDGKPVMARGDIRPDGTFALRARTPGEGVAVGTSRVRLVPPPTADVDSPAATLPFDKKYTDFDTSGLTVEMRRGAGDVVVTLGCPSSFLNEQGAARCAFRTVRFSHVARLCRGE